MRIRPYRIWYRWTKDPRSPLFQWADIALQWADIALVLSCITSFIMFILILLK